MEIRRNLSMDETASWIIYEIYSRAFSLKVAPIVGLVAILAVFDSVCHMTRKQRAEQQYGERMVFTFDGRDLFCYPDNSLNSPQFLFLPLHLWKMVTIAAGFYFYVFGVYMNPDRELQDPETESNFRLCYQFSFLIIGVLQAYFYREGRLHDTKLKEDEEDVDSKV